MQSIQNGATRSGKFRWEICAIKLLPDGGQNKDCKPKETDIGDVLIHRSGNVWVITLLESRAVSLEGNVIPLTKESGESAKIQGMFGFSEILCDRIDQARILELNRNQENALILFTDA